MAILAFATLTEQLENYSNTSAGTDLQYKHGMGIVSAKVTYFFRSSSSSRKTTGCLRFKCSIIAVMLEWKAISVLHKVQTTTLFRLLLRLKYSHALEERGRARFDDCSFTGWFVASSILITSHTGLLCASTCEWT